jgi:23S rRNA (pseudouridine1915-N3)-methyltransferase
LKLVICAVGRLKSGPERQLAERYLERAGELAPKLGFWGPSVIEIAESRARDACSRRREEGEVLAGKTDGALRILLDEHGRHMTSAEFAELLGKHRACGAKALAFLIGSADGLSHEAFGSKPFGPKPLGRNALGRKHETMSFGAMTLPHQLVRILLLEQIYRALTIGLGHPYHRQ